jgi:predicted RecA/RadA family phage recombinase
MTNAMNGGAAREGNTFPVSNGGSFDINQGDLVYFDTSAHYLKPLDSDAHAATFVGVAYDSSFLNLYGQKKYDDGITVQQKGVARLFQTAGDTYHDGDTVYLGADAQTITNTAGGSTHPLGVIFLPMGNTVTGAAGALIEVRLLPQFPGTGVA